MELVSTDWLTFPSINADLPASKGKQAWRFVIRVTLHP